MRQLELSFEYSGWFLVLCLLAGALYAFILYQRKGPWNKQTNWILAGGRFLLVSILTFLLIGPFIKQIKNEIEPPQLIFAIDNSISVKEATDSLTLQNTLNNIERLAGRLEEEGFQVSIQTLNENTVEDPASIQFDQPGTDLSNLLYSIQNNYENRALAGVMLFSDGIVNMGVSPTYRLYNFEVHSIGMGDTTTKADVNLRALYYNQITYQGNKFPVVAEVVQNGFDNTSVSLEIWQDDQLLQTKNLDFESDDQVYELEFLLDAEEKGMQHYQVRAIPKEDEYTTTNNSRDAYIDVIEGKEKILVVAAAPHPDIKAIRSALSGNQNYELEVFIPGIDNNINDYMQGGEQQFDLVIFHQMPDIRNSSIPLIEKFVQQEVPLWFIVGNQTNLTRFNAYNETIAVEPINNQRDLVTPYFNSGFSSFLFNDEWKGVINEYPPMTVPFGKTELQGEADVLLYQRVGRIETNKPLLVIRRKATEKIAVLLGDGLWQWRLQEFARNENQEAFDALVLKLVQYLSSKEDRRKFKVYPVKNEFLVNESIVFETEVYNDIYERIYGHKINLTISGENDFSRNFSYVTSNNNSQYRVTGLEQGIYQYTANAEVDGKTESSSGEFSVRELQIETIDLQANHDLLRSLSQHTNGEFFRSSELESLEKTLRQRELKGIILSTEEFLPIINMQWIFFLLLVLVTIEWSIRKFNGSY